MSTQIQPDTGERDPGKLAGLRARTDRDLAALLHRMLDRGFALASQAEYPDAEAVYARIARLLPLASSVETPEFTTLRPRLHDLRAYLDEVTLAGACLAS
ncbi:MAG: hypothetical protein LAP40_13835 [Acidobacteriia bacterium]|nr:hypothetical protein [Terriglobia bacterium]